MARFKLAVSFTALIVAGGLATSVVAQQGGSGAQPGAGAPNPARVSRMPTPAAPESPETLARIWRAYREY